MEINEKISKYAVLKLTATTEKSSKSVTKGSAPTAKKNNQKSKELAEVEAELEVNSTLRHLSTSKLLLINKRKNSKKSKSKLI